MPGLTYLSLGSLPLFVDHKKSIQFFPKLEELLLDNISLHDDIFYGAAENLPELLLLDVSRSRLTECVLQDISMISSLESFLMVECTMVDDWALFPDFPDILLVIVRAMVTIVKVKVHWFIGF